MAAEEMKQKAREFVDRIWNRGDFDRISDYLTEDYVEHRPEGNVEGIEGLRQLLSTLRQAYPDFRAELHEIVADERLVACTYVAEGTMKGDFGHIRATGRHVRIDGIYMARIEGERIAEGWNRFDMLSVMTQLGIMSAPGGHDVSEAVASQQPRPPA